MKMSNTCPRRAASHDKIATGTQRQQQHPNRLLLLLNQKLVKMVIYGTNAQPLRRLKSE